MRISRAIAVNIVLPIFIGGIIYYVLSPNVIFVKAIDSMIGGGIHFDISITDNVILNFVRNYFLDMLWSYALVFAVFYLTGNDTAHLKKILLLVFAFSAAMELLQLTTVAEGTFDVVDILAELLAEVFAVIIIKVTNKKEELKDE